MPWGWEKRGNQRILVKGYDVLAESQIIIGIAKKTCQECAKASKGVFPIWETCCLERVRAPGVHSERQEMSHGSSARDTSQHS